MDLVSLQGDVYLATRSGGNPLAFRHLGNVPSIEIQMANNAADHFESMSGQRLQDGRLNLSKTATLRLVMDVWSADNLALALYSTKATIAGSTVSAETFPNPVAVGDHVRLAQQDVSSVVITDSAGSPATLVANTDYEITSAKHGTIKILGLAAYTQPFKAAYTYAGGTNMALFNTAPPELWLMVDGINTGESDRAVKAELYKVKFDPVGALQLMHNDGYSPLELSGVALYDSTKVGDTTLGQFGRMIEMAA